MDKTISVIIPAFNEQADLRNAVSAVEYLVKKFAADYEIIIVDDGSVDQTPQIADELSDGNPKIATIHNLKNSGFGFSLTEGFKKAKMNYLTFFPGDNSIPKESLDEVFSSLGKADLLTTYIENIESRPWIRKIFSKTFTALVNFIFCNKMKYYNGLTIYPTALVQSIRLRSTGHGLCADLLVRCLKMDQTYLQIPLKHNAGTDKTSKAFNLRNFRSVAKTIRTLIWDIYVRKNPKG